MALLASAGVEKTFRTLTCPPAKTTQSVNVPPVSTPMRIDLGPSRPGGMTRAQ